MILIDMAREQALDLSQFIRGRVSSGVYRDYELIEMLVLCERALRHAADAPIPCALETGATND